MLCVVHVYGNIAVEHNEMADRLAKVGAQQLWVRLVGVHRVAAAGGSVKAAQGH